MAMTLESAVIRWVDYQLNNDNPYPKSVGNIRVDGDKIYSYGHHFELGRLVQRPEYAGGNFWLLNGDRYSPSTDRHQRYMREAIARSEPKYPALILPYSTLGLAKVDLTTISPIDIIEDGFITHVHVVDTFDEVPEQHRWSFTSWVDDEEGTEQRVDGYVNKGYRDGYWHPGDPIYVKGRYVVTPNHGEQFLFKTHQHVLGESCFTATVNARDTLGRRIVRLGVSFLSSFDKQEHVGRHYFLCELPREPGSVAEAYESIKPDRIRRAEEAGMDVTRQGDVFAMPSMFGTRTEANMRKIGFTLRRNSDRNGRFYHSHAATLVAEREVDGKKTTVIRGSIYHLGGEHRRQKMGDGKTWYEFMPNLVPHDVATEGRRAFSIAGDRMRVD